MQSRPKQTLHAIVGAALIMVSAVVVPVPVQAQSQNKQVPANLNMVQLSFAPVVRETAPAVVNIYTAKTVRVRRYEPLFNDPFFQQFFGGQLRRAVPGPKTKVQNSLGSGVIVQADGTIITNHHVIEGAEEIKVVLTDRREFPASVVGFDQRTDLAVLKVDTGGEALPVLELSDSDNLEVGDLVLAIGNPFGVGQTVTSGIVSGLARTRTGISDLNSFIQTDAAINPGNSGGALVGVDGRLIGINTAIFSKSGGSMGIGFAIPSNMVRSVLAGIQEGGRAIRPWFGASGHGVTQELAKSFGLDRPVGVAITRLYSGGPAERGGLAVGDVVLSINDHEVTDPLDLRFRIATLTVGETAPVVVWRRGREVKLFLPLEAPPQDRPANETLLKGPQPIAGAVIANMSPALADELGVSGDLSGVMIMKLINNTNAHRVGFKPGDFLVKINEFKILSVADVIKALEASNKRWNITIKRGGREISMVLGG